MLDPTRPEREERIGSVLKVLVPLQVLELERSVDEAAAMVMLPEPSKETVLMVTGLASFVAVPALPVTLMFTAVEVEMEATVFAPVA